MNTAVKDMVDVIREIVRQEISKRDDTVLCEIVEQTDINHYNLYALPDRDNVIHNVLNSSKFELQKGDLVYVYKVNNKFNQSFIVTKLLPFNDYSFNKNAQPRRNVASVTYNFYIDYDNGWNITIDPKLEDRINNAIATGKHVQFGIVRYMPYQGHKTIERLPEPERPRFKRQWIKRDRTYTTSIKNVTLGLKTLVTASQIYDQISRTVTGMIYNDATPIWKKHLSRTLQKRIREKGYWYRLYSVYVMIDQEIIEESQRLIEVRSSTYEFNPLSVYTVSNDPNTGRCVVTLQ